VVADAIIAQAHGNVSGSRYNGEGICYLECGHNQVAKVEVAFLRGQPPNGRFESPSSILAADKVTFGSSRIRDWFDRDWAPF
jgi:sulfide:quinone oxidoreductase